MFFKKIFLMRKQGKTGVETEEIQEENSYYMPYIKGDIFY